MIRSTTAPPHRSTGRSWRRPSGRCGGSLPPRAPKTNAPRTTGDQDRPNGSSRVSATSAVPRTTYHVPRTTYHVPTPTPRALVSETKGLHRVLTLRDVTLFYIVAVIGPRWIGNAAAAGPSSILLWALACLGMFIPSAFTVLELSTRYPEEGGIYVWARETFGEFAGFM